MQPSIEQPNEDVGAEARIHDAIAPLIHTVHAWDQDTVWALVTTAALKLPAVNYASVFVVGPGSCVRHLASTHFHARLLNQVEQRYMQGPGLDAACEQQAHRVEDLTGERRWPDFRDEAADVTPIRSILSLPLSTHHHGKAVLNLYADAPHSFGAENERLGLAFAGEAQVILATGHREKRYRKTLTNRDLIGQAKGMLMERFDIDPVAAFSLLAQLSKKRQQSVSVVAERLVTGHRDKSRRNAGAD
jgi:hypothetical protein